MVVPPAHSEDIQDVFLTSYVRLIYVFLSEGNLIFNIAKTLIKMLFLSDDCSLRSSLKFYCCKVYYCMMSMYLLNESKHSSELQKNANKMLTRNN